MMMDFSQRRMNEVINTPQGTQNVPFMRNDIKYKGYAWNVYEIASYRQRLKEENLELLETFVDEISQIKEDLMYYVNYLEGSDSKIEESNKKTETSSKNSNNKKSDYTFVAGPFQGLGELFSPLIPHFKLNFMEKHEKETEDKKRDTHHKINKLIIAEDTWKLYTVHKKTKGFMQY